MADIPNLAGIATADLVEQIGGGNFKASYINWARTLHLLRVNAPGWMPCILLADDGSVIHRAPNGAFMLLYFTHSDGSKTVAVPQAIMDARNNSIPYEKITSRDITDTHRRGICLAASLTFGLAYELWAKMPLESGYRAEDESQDSVEPTYTGKPLDGVWEGCTMEERERLEDMRRTIEEYADMEDFSGAHEYIARESLDAENKMRLWSLLPSKTRTALKKEADHG